jgi:hypothetical protein
MDIGLFMLRMAESVRVTKDAVKQAFAAQTTANLNRNGSTLRYSRKQKASRPHHQLSGGGEFYREGNRGMGRAKLGKGFAYYFLGKTSTLAALTGNTCGLAYFTITAAAFVNGFADLAVGNTLAEADIHIAGTVAVRLGMPGY